MILSARNFLCIINKDRVWVPFKSLNTGAGCSFPPHCAADVLIEVIISVDVHFSRAAWSTLVRECVSVCVSTVCPLAHLP